jgi:phosphomannomutase
MSEIKFGTDGWRAIIAREYTVDNVKRVAEATARWMLGKKMNKVVIGFDCRFGGKMFAETTASVFGNFGINVIMAEDFVSTPVVSYCTAKTGSDMGIVITASHNPPDYNGFKLKSAYGGPTSPADIEQVEMIIPDTPMGSLPSVVELRDKGIIQYIDLDQMYLDHVKDSFDLNKIKSSGIKIAYDAMFGAGQKIMKTLFPEAELLHCDFNPSFYGQAPEPIEKNLTELSNLVATRADIHIGIAHDGDGDRIGLFDEDGKFVDSHHILLLLLYYLVEYKNMDGKVIITFSVTDKMKKLAEKYGRSCDVTKIGFKYIAEKMVTEDVLVGGEESGGLAVKGHVPERDGIWIALMILEFMATTGKSVKQLVNEVYDRVGSFAFSRNDLHLSNDKKLSIIEDCKSGRFTSFGHRAIIQTETLDGFKFHVSDGEWILVRPSGTEPVLRVYSQAADEHAAKILLDVAVKELLS